MQAAGALLWERWRRSRWALLTATLAPLSGWLVGLLGYRMVGMLVSLSCWVLGTLLLMGVLLFGQSDLQNLSLGFPRRLFRFPVTTPTLLALYLGYGIVAAGLPYLPLFGYAQVFGIPYPHWWTVFMILETMFIWLQTLAWLKGARGVFLFLIPSVAGVLTLFYLTTQYGLSLEINLICSIMIVLSWGISFWNVSGDRWGAWISGWRWMEFLAKFFRRGRAGIFRSPLRALTWFESRQTGYLFPLSVLCFFGPLLVYTVLTGMPYRQSSPVALVSHQSIIKALRPVLIAAWIGGALSFAVYHRNRKSGAENFWLRQPVSTPQLAFARLKTMARSVTITLGILLVVLVGLLLKDWITPGLTGSQGFFAPPLQDKTFPEIGLLILSALTGLALVCWILLNLPREIFLAVIGLEVVFAGVLVYFGGDFGRTLQFWASDLVRWAGCVVALGLIMITLRLSYMAFHRKLIGKKVLTGMASFYPVAVVSLYSLGLWIGWFSGWPGPMESFYLSGAGCLPLIPVAKGPLSIARQRQR